MGLGFKIGMRIWTMRTRGMMWTPLEVLDGDQEDVEEEQKQAH